MNESMKLLIEAAEENLEVLKALSEILDKAIASQDKLIKSINIQ